MAVEEPPSTSALLLSAISAYSTLTKNLFTTIETPSSSSSSRPNVPDVVSGQSWSTQTLPDILHALQQVDSLLAARIKTARQHATNQARIEKLQRKAKARSRQTRRAVLELSGMKNDLQDLLTSSRDELKAIRKAEKAPLPHKVVLAYAHRLAKYTSAPPGYQLPQIAAAAAAATAAAVTDKPDQKTAGDDDEQQDSQALKLGPEYNQYAKRAAAYYDPAMPSMPQEMPFPSDAMMRQGILNSAEMLNGAQMALVPALQAEGEEDTDMLDKDAQESAPAGPAYTDFYSQQQQHRDNEDDAFDLDLN